ncbi:hypothetical protein [Klebsiella phage SAKp15]
MPVNHEFPKWGYGDFAAFSSTAALRTPGTPTPPGSTFLK